MVKRKKSESKNVAIVNKISRRRETPTRVNAVVRSDGLVLQIGVPEIEARQAKALASSLVSDFLPGDWEIQPLDGTIREFILRRPADQPNPTVEQAFDWAAKLREHRDVEDCEPSLVLPFEPTNAIIAERDSLEDTKASPTVRSRRSGSTDSGSSGTPASCSIDNQWVLSYCKVQEAWDLPLPPGGKSMGDGILIAHPDTGYTKHPELDADRVLANQGRNFEEGNNHPHDPLNGKFGGHGTSTGSVIMSGKGPGALNAFVTGVAPKSKLVPLRMTNSVILVSFARLTEAIRYAADRGFHVISISLGGPLRSRHLARSIQYAIDRGVIIVAAAGNVWPFVVYPAKLDQVIAVAATDCYGQVWRGSASGPSVDIAAPGDGVWRALAEPGNQFSVAPSSGTSFATAMVAGAASLWLAYQGRDPLINRVGAANLASLFKETLLRYGFDRPSGWNTRAHGAGILNVQKLLQAPLPSRAAAGGMSALHASSVSRLQNAVDHLLELFPKSTRTTVRDRLCTIMGTTADELNDSLTDIANELEYHAVMDENFRHGLMFGDLHSSTRSSKRSTSSRTSREEVKVALPKRMSKMLRKRLVV